MIEYPRFQIAPGYDNLDYKPLADLNPPMFSMYMDYAMTPSEFKPFQEVATTSRYRQRRIGMPSARIVLPVVTNEERLYLRSTFCENGEDGPVTVNILNTDTMQHECYNAIMVIKPIHEMYEGWDYVEFRNFEIEFVDMRKIDCVQT